MACTDIVPECLVGVVREDDVSSFGAIDCSPPPVFRRLTPGANRKFRISRTRYWYVFASSRPRRRRLEPVYESGCPVLGLLVYIFHRRSGFSRVLFSIFDITVHYGHILSCNICDIGFPGAHRRVQIPHGFDRFSTCIHERAESHVVENRRS